MLLSLYDDCLEYIFKFLELTDQAALAFVCERLKDLLFERVWRRNCKEVNLNSETSDYFNKNEEIFKCYMSAISGRVEHLEFIGLHVNTLNVLCGLTFPKLTRLQLVEHTELIDVVNVSPQFIAAIFPHLEKLTLNSPNVNGKNLWRLTALKHLDLINCENVLPQYVSEIFSCVQLQTLNLEAIFLRDQNNKMLENINACQSLEELAVPDFYQTLCWKLQQLPKLRQLKMYLYDDKVSCLLPTITSLHDDTMKTVIFKDAFEAEKMNLLCVLSMSALQRLILVDDRITCDQIIKIGRVLGESLIEVRFISSVHKNHHGLADLLQHCTNLRILDISRNYINIEFLRFILANSGRRTTPLLIRCYNTRIEAHDLECFELPNFVEVSLEEYDFAILDRSHIQCEWELNETIDE